MNDIELSLRRIASIELGIPYEKAKTFERIDDDYNVDSMKLLQYILSVEVEYKVKLDEDSIDISTIMRFKSFATLISSLIARDAAFG